MCATAINGSQRHRTCFTTPLFVLPHRIFSETHEVMSVVADRKLADDKQRKSNLLLVSAHHQLPMARYRNRAFTSTKLQ